MNRETGRECDRFFCSDNQVYLHIADSGYNFTTSIRKIDISRNCLGYATYSADYLDRAKFPQRSRNQTCHALPHAGRRMTVCYFW